MKVLTLVAAMVSLAFLSAAPVSRAGVATLEGIVKDAGGHPLKGAEIRIQGSDARVGIVHTNANGHYAYPALETGEYHVTLVVDGIVKASIANVRTQTGETQSLNFALQRTSGATPLADGKHYVWIPPGGLIGTHLGGWVEVDNGTTTTSVARQRMNDGGNAMVKELWDEHPATTQ